MEVKNLERVKYYSINDLTNGNNLKKCEILIKVYDKGKEAENINDIIELYNVKKYFDIEIYLVDWTRDEINHYQVVAKTFMSKVAKFFKSITDESFMPLYLDVDYYYRVDFWEISNIFKVYENISYEKFNELLHASKISLHELLKHKNITEYYGWIIRDYMLENISSAELLLDRYELKHIREKDPLFFPSELSNSDKEIIINSYIDSEDPNLNYLRLIANIQSSKDKIELSPKTLLKAKRKVEDNERLLFNENTGMVIETTVSFSKTQKEEVTLIANGDSTIATYSTKWIEDNQDYPTLLNNFIYLFEFVDLQMRFTLVNKNQEMGVFEKHLFTSSQHAYTTGFVFEHKNILSLLQMEGYYNQLFSRGIRLEEVIEWFFEDYLAAEFGAQNLTVTMPSAQSTLLEKCTNIMPGLESVLKQFSLFVEEGHIDFELLDIRSEQLIYKNIPSLVKRKYAYGKGEEFETATFLLFSDQSSLGHVEHIDNSYNNFFELISNEKTKENHYLEYQIPKINWLIENSYLSIDTEGYLVFEDAFLIRILNELNFNEVISYWKYPEPGRKIIDLLEEKNIIELESSLFSRPEQEYINFTLNKSQFNNGLDLRNRYIHTQPKSVDDMLHNQNYKIFLRLFILTVIKINDDCCTRSEMESR